MIKSFLKSLAGHKILLVILLIGVILRFVGTNPGYNQFHSDEGISYSAAISMIKNGNLDPLRYDYPTMVPLINYAFFKFIFIPLGWVKYYLAQIPQIIDGLVHIPIAKLEARRILQVFIFGEREINALFWGRYVTAFFSLGSIFAVYLLAKKLFNKNIALISSLLLAVNFRAVVNSHIGLPDTYNAFFLLLSLIFSYRIIENSSVKNYLLAGLFLGFSFSTKYQFFAVLPLLVSHVYVSLPNWKKLFSCKIILSGLAAMGVYVFLNPYSWVHFEEFIDIVSYISKKYAMGRMKLMIYPLHYFYSVDYGLPLFISIFIGFIYSLKKFAGQTLFLLSVVMPFFFVMIYFSIGGFYVRNFITITPILLIFAAVFINLLFSKLRKNIFSSGLFVLILLGIIYVPLRNSILNSFYYTKTWAYKNILNKAKNILPEGAIVASHPFDPLPDNVVRTDFERSISYSLSEFREVGADYALINMDWASADFYGWMLETLPKSLNYYKKPINEMRTIFSGLAIEEMMPFVQASSYKPWQAPDAALFLLKVPYFRSVDFANGSNVQMDNERFISEEFNVKPNFVYKVTGLMKSEKPVDKNKRDSFLKMDFFNSKITPERKVISTSISSRYHGEGWQRVELIAVAPIDAKSAQLSLQSYSGVSGPYSLKDIIMEESHNPYPQDETYEKINFNQYKDLLYPYSHGNL